MQRRLEDLQRSAELGAEITKERSEFSKEFSEVCDAQVRPVMDAVLARLRANGGGGVIEERPEDLRRMQDHRLVLWMSLEGEIVGTPRQDRHPYLQLDAAVARRAVTVSEGDMWAGHGGNRSGQVAEWRLSAITAAKVTEEILAILRRSIEQGVLAL
jgi:hypothetical protein